jgi:NAD(P)-dependent dehydrogenase (short-subunit alcohol dehydrogenase family)
MRTRREASWRKSPKIRESSLRDFPMSDAMGSDQVAGLTKAAALEFAQKGIRVQRGLSGCYSDADGRRILDKGGLSEEQIFAAEPMHRMGKCESRGRFNSSHL